MLVGPSAADPSCVICTPALVGPIEAVAGDVFQLNLRLRSTFGTFAPTPGDEAEAHAILERLAAYFVVESGADAEAEGEQGPEVGEFAGIGVVAPQGVEIVADGPAPRPKVPRASAQVLSTAVFGSACVVRYTVSVAGNAHRLHVQLGGIDIEGSPLRLSVVAAPTYAPNCLLRARPPTAEAWRHLTVAAGPR
eukprot:1500543-Prymnesium_polylepis.1